MSRLTDIHVRRISFVGKAAVRDPANPTQPRRFVLFKAEEATPTPTRKDVSQMAGTSVSDGDIDVSSGAQAAIGKALLELKPHLHEPRVRALSEKLAAIASPEDFGDGEEGVTAAIKQMDVLRKSADLPEEVRKQADLASRQLQYERLAKSNPRGAELYAKTHPELIAV